MNYFEKRESAFELYGEKDNEVIALMANRFIGENPQAPYQYRLDFTSGILCNTSGWYQFDYGRRFPKARTGQVCYSIGNLYCHSPKTANFQLRCYGPTACFVNGEEVFHSLPGQENFREPSSFPISLKAGQNRFLFETEKTEIGFGFLFRNAMPQWEPTHFTAALEERQGQAGFAYTAPLERNSSQALALLGGSFSSVYWLPKQEYESGASPCPLIRIFGSKSSGTVAAKSSFFHKKAGNVRIKGHTNTSFKVFAGEELCCEAAKGDFEIEFHFPAGICEVILLCKKEPEKESGLALSFEDEYGTLSLNAGIKGYEGEWIYAGVFGKELPDAGHFTQMNRVHPSPDGNCYWKGDLPAACVRIFAEEELYGKWTYPCGVTLYGILKAGEFFDRKDWLSYVQEYAAMTAEVYEYALYDKKVFGYPGVDTQISWLEELDDCGSFGSFLLEALRLKDMEGAVSLANAIADFMEHQQHREKDLVFSRNDGSMWTDDMYMSIPFLCRYYQLSGQEAYLAEACRQALLFQQYFYMPEQGLMSHIFDVTHQKINKIPWSRGNGWVLFSLSELLLVLPKEHPNRTALETFFTEMIKGVLQVQGENGLWHQILDDPSTYEEASSTSMFICAFSRGIRLGIFDEELKNQSRLSLEKAWRGMKQTAISRKGDLYGVCQGSGCSFSRSYYQQLGWRFNDPHGIGIGILAGVEKMMADQ